MNRGDGYSVLCITENKERREEKKKRKQKLKMQVTTGLLSFGFKLQH